MTRQSLTRDLWEAPAFIEIRVIDEDVATPQHVAELVDIEAMRLEVGTAASSGLRLLAAWTSPRRY